MMTKKTILIIVLAGMSIFLFFVIARTPAKFVAAHISNNYKTVAIHQTTGTIWNGAAANIILSVNGKLVSLGYTEWEVSMLPLLLGKVAVTLDANKPNQTIKGDFVFGLGSHVEAENVQMSIDASLLKTFSPFPIDVQGAVDITLNEAVYSDNIVETLDGNVVLRDGVVKFGSPIELGTYVTKLSVIENVIQGKISDIDGVMEMDGLVTLAPETKKYTADLTMKPKEGANPLIVDSLKKFTRKKPDGSYQFKF